MGRPPKTTGTTTKASKKSASAVGKATKAAVKGGRETKGKASKNSGKTTSDGKPKPGRSTRGGQSTKTTGASTKAPRGATAEKTRGPAGAGASPAHAPKAAGAGVPKASSAPTRQHDADMEPFAVTATDIANLDDDQFRRFMRELLRNEAATCDAEFIDNPGDGSDDGQDAETRRPGAAPVADNFIPLGVTVWQYKAEKKAPSESEFEEEIDKVQPKAALKSGGSYCFVAQQPSKNESTKRDLLRKVARKRRHGADQVNFYAQASLAERARRFPALALLQFFRRPLDHVHDLGWWAEAAPDVPFDVQSRQTDLDRLSQFIRTARRPAHARVIGPAGVGKTRLVLEALARASAEAATAYAPNPNGSTFLAFNRWVAQHRREVARIVLVSAARTASFPRDAGGGSVRA